MTDTAPLAAPSWSTFAGWVAEIAGIEAAAIRPESLLVAELALDSLDLLELADRLGPGVGVTRDGMVVDWGRLSAFELYELTDGAVLGGEG